MQARVLLVEDEDRVVEAVRTGLADTRIQLEHAGTIAGAQQLLKGPSRFDAVVLDLGLPDGDGSEIAAACQRAEDPIPIIMVTARDTVADRVAGLESGADDYLCKPFSVDELRARLSAVLRRSRRPHRHTLEYADLKLDILRREATRGATTVKISVKELDLLVFLMSHPEQVLSKETILKGVWGEEQEQDANVLHVYTNYLRNKLEAGGQPRLIHTVRGAGYILSRTDPANEPPIDFARPAT